MRYYLAAKGVDQALDLDDSLFHWHFQRACRRHYEKTESEKLEKQSKQP
jgi:hypothetical protein